MARSIGGAVAGYIVMALVVMLTFTGAYLILGAEGTFKPGSYEISNLWLFLGFAFGALAAATGGLVCASIARGDRRGPLFLVILVLVLGAAVAVGEKTKDRPSVPAIRTTDSIGNAEAVQKAFKPLWVTYLDPFVGAAGAVLGSRLRRSSRAAA